MRGGGALGPLLPITELVGQRGEHRLPFVEAAELIHHHRIDDGLGVHAQPALCVALQIDRSLAEELLDARRHEPDIAGRAKYDVDQFGRADTQ